MDTGVDLYISKAKSWKDEMTLLRTILLSCKLDESIKWGQPCYSSNNKNLIIIAPFKTHCDLGIFNGATLKDEKGLLVKAGVNTQSSRQLRFTNLEEIKKNKSIIASYVKEAIENEKKGLKFIPDEADKTIHVAELETIFKKNAPLKKAFTALTPGRQRAYLIHFSGAKQSATRIARIEKYTDAILAGRGINDCTCGLSKKMPYCDGSHKYA
ncbi:MAG: hypothetical protein RIT38_475 [Bacteroidota bacterium]|jgi:uncharacterized protein YdeI (YjbR/CyaY-like superfamily)